MKYSLLFLFILAPGFLFAQKGKKKTDKAQYPTWFASAHFAFQNSNVVVHADQTWNLLYDDLLFFQGGSGRAGGIMAGFGPNKNLDVMLGATFGKQGIIQSSHFPIAFCDPAEYGATERVGTHRFVTITGFEVPLEARYKFFIGRAFSIYPALGGSLAFTLNKKQQVEVYMDNGAVATHPDNDFDLDNDRPVNVALQAKMGFRLQLARPLFIKVEPFYKRYLAKEQLLTDFEKTSLRTFGVLAGVEYALRFR